MKKLLAPKLSVLMGPVGIRQAYEMTLNSRELLVKCLSTKYDGILDGWFEAEYAPRLYQGRIKLREIVQDTNKNRQSYQKTRHQVAYLGDKFQSETDFMITDTAVIFVAYSAKTPFALVIENEEIVSSMKIQFEALWQMAIKQ